MMSYSTGPTQHPQQHLTHGVEVAVWLAIAAVGLTASHLLDADTTAGSAASFASIVVELGLVLYFHRRRNDAWSALGLGRPRSLWKTVGLAVLITPLVMVLPLLVESLVVTPLLQGESPDISRFDALRGNLPMLIATLVSVWFSAALAEEVLFRGFLMGRIARLLGGRRMAWWSSLAASSVLFGLLHLYQGVAGMLMTGFVGLLLGTLYLVVRRNLWICILVHGLIDTIALSLVYAGMIS